MGISAILCGLGRTVLHVRLSYAKIKHLRTAGGELFYRLDGLNVAQPSAPKQGLEGFIKQPMHLKVNFWLHSSIHNHCTAIIYSQPLNIQTDN